MATRRQQRIALALRGLSRAQEHLARALIQVHAGTGIDHRSVQEARGLVRAEVEKVAAVLDAELGAAES